MQKHHTLIDRVHNEDPKQEAGSEPATLPHAGWAVLTTTHQFGLATKLTTARCRNAAAWIKTRKAIGRA